MFLPLQNYMQDLPLRFPNISEERKEKLEEMADYILLKMKASKPAKLLFICTHNSRRSHFAQIWTAVAAHYAGISTIGAYSGGTEVTAFNLRAVAALQRAGIITNQPQGKNPKYTLGFSRSAKPITCYSKRFDDPANPQRNFAAIMTCSEADADCPLVPGAELRVPLNYQDPKEWDNTPQEEALYDERCLQIATELFFMVNQVQEAINS
jgi:hypothetical protein